MLTYLNNSTMLEESKKAKHKFNAVLNILISIALFIVTQLVLILPTFLIYSFRGGIYNALNPSNFNSLVALFSTAVLTIVCIVYCRFIEKRSFRSIGIIKKGFLKEYGKGLLVGFIMFSGLVLILIVTDNINYEGLTSPFNPIILVFFLGYLFQGASEEFLCRGFLMNSIGAKNGAIAGIIINSVYFSLLHIFNPGFSFLPFLNIVLVGLFFSLYAYRTDNIIGVCAIHSMWNFAQGNIYGISVSGTGFTPSVLDVGTMKSSFVAGGVFGAEGGLACTIVLLISLALIIYLPKKSASISNQGF